MEYKINPEFILLIEKLKGKHKFDDLYDTGFQELTGNTYDYISEELIGIYLKSLGYTGIISVHRIESVHENVDYYWDVYIKELKNGKQ